MSPALVTRHRLVVDGGVDRLDAEFFDGEYTELESRLKDLGATPLEALASLSDRRTGDPGKGCTDPAECFTYIEISDVDTRDGFVVVQPTPKLEAPSRARMLLHNGEVVLSSVRPARNAAFLVTPDFDKAIASTGFVVLTSLRLPAEVLFAFLKTRAAIMQLERRARASMYPALNPPDVLDILVPALTEELQMTVIKTVRKAMKSRRNFLAELDKTMKLANAFFETMRPDQLAADLKATAPRTLMRSELLGKGGSNRMDAEFYAPAFARLGERMRTVGEVKSIGDLAERVETGRTPAAAAYTERDAGGVVVIKVGTLTNRGLKWSDAEFAPMSFAREDSIASEGDVLFTSSAHAPAHISRKADVVAALPEGWAGRTTFVGELMRVRLADNGVPPGYLAAFLRHSIGGEQVRRCTRGITSHVYPADIERDVAVPIPPDHVARGIAEHSAKAEAARWKYTALVREAVKAVEDAVNSTEAGG